MLSAVKTLHSFGIVHGDIKPSHFVTTSDRSHLKVIDFGSSGLLPKGDEVIPFPTTLMVRWREARLRWFRRRHCVDFLLIRTCSLQVRDAI